MNKKVSLDTTGSLVVALPGGGAPPISILPVLALDPQLDPFREAADNVEAQAGRAVIDSEESWQRGSDFLTVCDEQWNQLETLRKATKGPIDDYGKFIQALFVPLQTRFKLPRGEVAGKMDTFRKAEETRRKVAAAAVQKANEEAAAKLAQEAEDRGDTAAASAILEVATLAPVAPAPMRLGGTNSFGKSTHTVKRWTASVENPMELLKAIFDGRIPISVIDWKQLELNKVAAALKVEKTVFGLKVYQTETTQQR